MLLTRDPYSNHTGRGLVLKTAIKMLSRLGVELTIVCFDDTLRGPKHHDCVSLGAPGLVDALRAVLNSYSKSLPLNELLYFNRYKFGRLEELVRQRQPDFLFVDMIRLAPYAMKLGLPSILDLDDLLSLRYKTASRKGHVTGFGYLDSKIPHWLSKVFIRFNSILLNRESRLLMSRELYYAREMAVTSLVSADEAKRINLAHGTNIISLPMMIDSCSSGRRAAYAVEYDSLFVGTLDYDANKRSFVFLAEEVLPKIRRVPGYENFELTLVGRTKHESLLTKYEGVNYLGYVEDLSAVYCASRVVLAPSFLPGGIKTKVIEALGHGCPTIANSYSLQGLDEVRCIVKVAENANEWVDGIRSVFENMGKDTDVVNAGIEYTENNFGEKVIVDSWIDALSSLGLRTVPVKANP